MSPLTDLLTASNLSHLADILGSESLESCSEQFTALGRPGYIKALKDLGVEKLGDRQKLATVIAKAAKSGGDVAAATESTSGTARPQHLRHFFSVTLAKDQRIDDVTSSMFNTSLQPLASLGGSSLLPGEVATVSGVGKHSGKDVRKPDSKVRLIALYGSGHDATYFDDWKASTPKWLELRVLELPGHGTRSEEPFWTLGYPSEEDGALSDGELYDKLARERDQFITTLADQLQPLLTTAPAVEAETGAAAPVEIPYALYGFSSGALFSYLLIFELQRRKLPLPFRFFACGRGAPHCVWHPDTIRLYHCASEDDMELMLHHGLAVPLVPREAPSPATAAMHDPVAATGNTTAGDQDSEVASLPAAEAKATTEDESGQAESLEELQLVDEGHSTSPTAITAISPMSVEDIAAAVTRKNAFWRAPLLTAAICVGAPPSEGPYFGGAAKASGRLGTGGKEPKPNSPEEWEACAAVKHAAGAPKLPVPLVVIASSKDRVWPDGLSQRWEEVAAATAAHPGFYRFVKLGSISHFKLLTAKETQEVVYQELAEAAAGQVSQLRF